MPSRLPKMTGCPITLEIRRGLRDRRGSVLAGAFLRERRIVFDADLMSDPGEFARVFTHEIYHFVWLRLGNSRRGGYEELLLEELAAGARGELGWSAEWRKKALAPVDARRRTRRWREYVCESFCDTAAWLYSGVATHVEYTLAARFRQRRRRWFEQQPEMSRQISI